MSRTRSLLAVVLLATGCAPTEIDCGPLVDEACLAAMEDANAALHAADPDARFASITFRGLGSFDGTLDDGRSANSRGSGVVITGAP